MSKLCALCGRHPIETEYRPFCSRRCADVDLQRWFTGAYAVRVEDEDSAAPSDDPEGRS
jgi:endogenous inhibitor of DNA gyrase (YacG/DUF329 family)